MWKYVVLAASIPTILVLALGIDFAMFRAYATALNRPAGVVAYIEMRTGAETKPLAAPLVATVTPMGSKKDMARQIDAIYPPAPAGWTKRKFVEADFWKLFPEMAFCAGRNAKPTMVDMMDGDPEGCPLKPGEKGAWVYEKGHEIVALHIKYIREKHEGPRVSSGPKPSIVTSTFGADYYNSDYPQFMRYNNIKFGTVPTKHWYRAGKTSNRTKMIYGRGTGDGKLHSFAIARASNDAIKKILMQINRDMVASLLKQPEA
ncbi:hypothetical protein [uncultured Pelagimonas sp.]|uniref:hypothetical protein n=1 Tax=uncultured Pelagimonas sp. TaxID=1618102 RepID=UPI00260E9302|nr:hypothetical protein [uncultured Pelagimonas sp.]